MPEPIKPEETNLDKKEEQNLDNRPEVKSEFGSAIRNAFGLKSKEQPKEPDKKIDKKPDEKAPEKPNEAVKEPDKTNDKEPDKEPEFDEILYNKEKVKIPVTERQTYLQKGYNYDKVKTDAEQAKATLQRIAKMEGFDTVDKYLAELDNREKAKLAEKIEEAAGDPDKIDEIVKNHPEVQRTKEERRKLDYSNAKAKLSEDSFFKKLEPELDDLMAKNPAADTNLVYSVLVGNYVRSDAYKAELAKEKEAAAKEKQTAKESAEKKVIADVHDKERRAAPTGGDTGEGKDLVQPSAFASKLSSVFGVSAAKIAQRSHEKMKRS